MSQSRLSHDYSHELGNLSGYIVQVKNFPRQAGETDDTARVQRAINSLPSNGGRVVFANEAYTISAQLVYSAGGLDYDDGTFGSSRWTMPSIQLEGVGASSTINANFNDYVFYIHGRAHFCAVENLKINNPAGSGIKITASMHGKIRDNGINVRYTGFDAPGTGVHVIKDNVIQAQDCIVLNGGDMFVNNNDLYFTEYGVQITALGDDKINENTFTYFPPSGYTVPNTPTCVYATGDNLNQIHVKDNQLFVGDSSVAVAIISSATTESYDNQITGNTFWATKNNTQTLVQIYKSFNLEVANNTGYFGGGDCYVFQSVRDSEIHLGTIRDFNGRMANFTDSVRNKVDTGQCFNTGDDTHPCIELFGASQNNHFHAGYLRSNSTNQCAIKENNTCDGNTVKNVRMYGFLNPFVRVGGYSSFDQVEKVDAPPSANAGLVAGAWKQGDILYARQPVASGNIGWVCVGGNTAGTAGTWKTFGAISA